MPRERVSRRAAAAGRRAAQVAAAKRDDRDERGIVSYLTVKTRLEAAEMASEVLALQRRIREQQIAELDSIGFRLLVSVPK
jgi:hypothetical protein